MTRTLRSFASLPPRAVADFFRLFAASGSVAFAADRTGLSRSMLYRRKRSDPAFAKRWAEAQELGVSKVRDEVFRRAVVGIKKPVFYGGAKIGKVRHYDNRLLWSLLRSHEPETYGNKRPQPVGGAPVDLARRLDEADERVARYEAGLRAAAKQKNS
ncbi:hypothetical protein [Reyranella sp.]|uniref:hypothetical protein n=1 Tax=Reyranella sp. TaxID=1929291 RepID=UPI002731940C|nr:hypothetical protein [Reyranella sp.]MDP2373860.1 hypothetical protein [Reyranella sp.]